ncbi:branched-chain amino acid ABC transporter permease [Limnochorda pilosa]|uniref:ABC transporter permease n=1 Tax=Limnochorda pilosa TaxID=1555112 RepID=A0A0K2SME4_LIMPI|nr:branched-chain amino acid ABC transporter permease [Limnochorda pilosa]BAS28004.1 ABC transporter permease [Limnochorda pilosa]
MSGRAEGRRRWIAASLGLAAAALALPALLGEYELGVATEILIYGLFAMSLDLLLGYAGLASLGQAAFFGAGAYAVGLLVLRGGASFAAALAGAVLVGALLALLFGLVVLRASGAYFLMLTLALGELLYAVAWLWRPVTGGDDGLVGIPRPTLPGLGLSFWDAASFYYLTLACVTLAALLLRAVVRSPFGLVLTGIRENEERLRVIGYDTWLYKYACYVIAGAVAALSGGLYTYFYGYVSPDYFGWALSGQVMLMVILGGAATVWGPLVGAGVVLAIQYVVSSMTDLWLSIVGILFILTVLFAPGGIAGLAGGLARRGAGAAAPDGVAQPEEGVVGAAGIRGRGE